MGFVPGAARVGQAAHGAARLERGRGTRRAELRGTGKKKGRDGEGAPTGGARWQAGGGRAGLDSGVRTGPGLLSARGWLGRSGGVARSWAEGVEADRAGLGSGPRGKERKEWAGFWVWVIGSFSISFSFLFLIQTRFEFKSKFEFNHTQLKACSSMNATLKVDL